MVVGRIIALNWSRFLIVMVGVQLHTVYLAQTPWSRPPLPTADSASCEYDNGRKGCCSRRDLPQGFRTNDRPGSFAHLLFRHRAASADCSRGGGGTQTEALSR